MRNFGWLELIFQKFSTFCNRFNFFVIACFEYAICLVFFKILLKIFSHTRKRIVFRNFFVQLQPKQDTGKPLDILLHNPISFRTFSSSMALIGFYAQLSMAVFLWGSWLGLLFREVVPGVGEPLLVWEALGLNARVRFN